MFDPITFILGIAGSVLTNVITDLITGKSKAARKVEMEKEISNQLIKHFEEANQDDLQRLKIEVDNLRAVKRKVMDEIEILAGRDPDLLISTNEIQLSKPLKKPFFGYKDSLVKQELFSRLNKLGEIIAQRREELGLITTPEGNEQLKTPINKSIEGVSKDSIVWKVVDTPNKELSRWNMEIIEMQDRIRRRRAGEDLSGEQ